MFKGVLEKVIASTLAGLLMAVVGFGIYINAAINTLSTNIGYSNIVVQNLADKVTRLEGRMNVFEVDFIRRIEILEFVKRIEQQMEINILQSRISEAGKAKGNP